MTSVAIAGSTGSIGTQTLAVLSHEPDRFTLSALGASGNRIEKILEQALATHPSVVALDSDRHATELAKLLPTNCELRAGVGALESIASESDVCINGVVGFAGLGVTLATLRAGKRLGLANKESLIAAGPVVQQARRTPGAELIPVDSEHAALHQCLRSGGYTNGTGQRTGDGVQLAPRRVRSLVLTASGGPFRGMHDADLDAVTLDDALAHPTWKMGPKITVDSSTLMNKGLEVIEAFELFGTPAGDAGVGIGLDDIDVVVHPESIVHSMVTFADASTIAQLSMPDMRLPISYALSWPDRCAVPFGVIDWTEKRTLHFEPPDRKTFRCLDLAYAAARLAPSAPAWLNAANEVVVEAFLQKRISWNSIAEVLEDALSRHDGTSLSTIDDVLDVDRASRAMTTRLIGERTP